MQKIRKSILNSLCVLLLVTFSLQSHAGKNEKVVTAADPQIQVTTGIASWYGPFFHGKKTATGEKYDMNGISCASNRYPLHTWLRVTNLKNGKAVVLRVNDRMHPRMTRIVDLSKGAARSLDMVHVGISKVKVENLGKNKPAGLP